MWIYICIFKIKKQILYTCNLHQHTHTHTHIVVAQMVKLRFDPWVGKIPGERNGNPVQYSCLENSTGRGAWQATQSMGSQRAQHDWTANTYLLTMRNKIVFNEKNWEGDTSLWVSVLVPSILIYNPKAEIPLRFSYHE